jgi:hypothetical protein
MQPLTVLAPLTFPDALVAPRRAAGVAAGWGSVRGRGCDPQNQDKTL